MVTAFLAGLFILSSVNTDPRQPVFFEKFLSAEQVEKLVSHVRVVQELKKRNKVSVKASDNPDSQAVSKGVTDLYLQVPALKAKVERCWQNELIEYQDLIDEMLQAERKWADTHYVFYHAHNTAYRVIQDFIKELYEFLSLSEPLAYFHFLRFWQEGFKEGTLADFIYSPWNPVRKLGGDEDKDLSRVLLSVNLSLFGNSSRIGDWECTFDYFVNNHSAYHYLKKSDFTLFEHFGFDKKYIKQLMALTEKIKTKEGILLQIFIPKELVDSCVYLSRPRGTPLPLREKVSALIEEFYHNPQADFDTTQARILFLPDLMLDPESNIKIVRYTTAKKHKVERYEKKLSNIVSEVVTEWLSNRMTRNNSTQLLANTHLYKFIEQAYLKKEAGDTTPQPLS